MMLDPRYRRLLHAGYRRQLDLGGVQGLAKFGKMQLANDRCGAGLDPGAAIFWKIVDARASGNSI
jgi:hypothetical protein